MKALPNHVTLDIAEKTAYCLEKSIGKIIRSALNETVKRYTDQVMTREQVAEYFGMTVAQISQMCHRGQIPFHKKGRKVFFSKNDLIDFFLDEESRNSDLRSVRASHP